VHLYEHEGVTVQIGGSDQFGNIVAGTDLVRRKRLECVAMGEVFIEQSENGVRELLGGSKSSEGNLQVRSVAEDYLKGLLVGEVPVSARDDDSIEARAMKLVEVAEHYAQYFRGKSHESAEALLEALDTCADAGRMALQGPTFGITAPLVTKADGTKFGKTEAGAVWLSAHRTSPYAYYQFWLNATDEDAANWIKVFTFLDEPTVNDLLAAHAENPGKRELQRTLAREATRILHGDEAMERAEAAGKALFSGEVAGLDEASMREVFADVPSSEHAAADLDGGGVDPVALLKETGLASSNREAREFLANGSVSINGEKIDADTRVSRTHLLHGSVMAIRRGKKKWHLARWV